MIPFKKTSAPPAPQPASLAAVEEKAVADLATALGNDEEATRLSGRVVEIRTTRAAAEAELQRIRKLRDDYLDARAAKLSVTAAADELLNADAPSGSISVSDEAVANAYRAITVATEALRMAQDRITARSRVLAAQIADRYVRPAVRETQRRAALHMARALGANAQVFHAIEALSRRGFGGNPVGDTWLPLEVFGVPAEMYSAMARALRDAMKYGLLSEDEAREAVGDYPGAVGVVTGRTPPPALPPGAVAAPPVPYIPSPPAVRYRETLRGLIRVPDAGASIIPS